MLAALTIFAEAGLYDFLIKLQESLTSPTFWVTLGNFVGICINFWRGRKDHREMKADLQENTKLCEQVVPAVAEKVDSATKKVDTAIDAANNIPSSAAAKVAVIIGKQLGDKAELTAQKVANAAEIGQAKLEGSISCLTKLIKGEDGTCITGRVEEHGRKIEALEGKVSLLLTDMQSVKTTLQDGTEKILAAISKATGQ